jgi:cytochrome c-type biogenesis protein CcmE
MKTKLLKRLAVLVMVLCYAQTCVSLNSFVFAKKIKLFLLKNQVELNATTRIVLLRDNATRPSKC